MSAAIIIMLSALGVYVYQKLFAAQPPQVPQSYSPHPQAPFHRKPTPASNSDNSYFPRTPKDIQATEAILSHRLPAELVLDIMERAEYWIRETAERNDRLVIAEPSAGTAYIRTWPILWASGGASSNSPPYPGTSYTFDNLAEEAPASSLPEPEPATSSLSGPVKKITFTLSSRDQGWSSNRQFWNTYEQSYTWFEARVIHPSAPPPPTSPELVERNGSQRRRVKWTNDMNQEQKKELRPRLLQHNLHACKQPRTHVVTWSANAEDEEERKWVRALRQGECIEVTAWARYPGWANHIEKVRVDVYCEG